MFLELVNGVLLSLALCYLQGFNIRIWQRDPVLLAVSSGCLFGGICVIGMLLPIEITPGVIFDARSVVLSMAGLFGSPLVALVAGVIAGGYRIWLGGGGMPVGVAVVVACVLLGLAYRYARQRGWVGIGFLPLLAFGLLVHLVVVGLLTQLPEPAVSRVMSEIALPFVLTFTPATALLGLLLRDIEERYRTEDALRDSEARLSLHLQNSPIAAIAWDRNFCTTQWNRAAEEIFGYSAAEALGRRAQDLIIPVGIVSDLDALFEQLLVEEGGIRNVNDNRTKDGRIIVCEWYNTPICDRSGTVTGVASLALDVLDISAIEAGKRPIVPELLNVAEIVDQSIEIIEPAAQRRDVCLAVDVGENLPPVTADRRAVKQILLNLLSNAVKFSEPRGGVALSVTCSDDTMTLTVADTGIGIEADVLPTVTDVFSRGPAHAHLAQEGTGLGLAIVKSLVEAHDGTLAIDSEVGKGTTVRVWLSRTPPTSVQAVSAV
jgi:PAS domain S-box-containing protein